MGYSLETVKGKMTLDSVTVTGMQRILRAAVAARVDLDSVRERTWQGRKREPVEASLVEAFSTNDGWWVTPKEAALLARRLPAVAGLSEDPPFIREAAGFFAEAAKRGGLYVW